MNESQMYYQSRKGKNEVYRSQGFTDRPEMSLLRKIDRSGTYGNELKS